MKKKFKILYVIVFLFVLLITSAGLLFGGKEVSQENDVTVKMPMLMEEGKINLRFFSELGEYYEKNFAFRKEIVSAYDGIMQKVFGSSGQEGVIVGTNQWLYYKDSLEDFQGSNLMTDRQLFDAAHTLAMIQEYAQKKDISFVFTIAPNKNQLYPENMPYYYKSFRNTENNLSRIEPYLEEEGVNYVDLYGMLKEQKEVLYHKTDSHWNNKGASMAAEAILSALDIAHRDYSACKYTVKNNFAGDLYAMLYPAGQMTEDEIYYDPEPAFSYVEEVENNFAGEISTVGQGEGKSLVMYRDSFGNALLPFMAEAFQEAYFSRGEPYTLSDLFVCDADTLVIEKAERFLPNLSERPPAMVAPIVSSAALSGCAYSPLIDYSTEEMGDYTWITGTIKNQNVGVKDRIFIRVNGVLNYEAFPCHSEEGEGYSLYLPTSILEEENTYEICLTE